MKRFVGLFIIILIGQIVFGQDQVVDNLQKDFNNYQFHNVREKIFVHTDKTFYLAGETLWFKVYLADASFHKALSISSIAYIEILNKDQKPVLQTKIAMTAGSGDGSVILPASLGSGNYVLRAYTNWMKNSDAGFFYHQELQIVNTLKVTAKKPDSKLYSGIQFFPEGGNALSDYPVKIAFKAVGPNGSGLDCEGIIVDQNNDIMSRFKSLHNGMGSFNLQYQKNHTYYAVLRLDDSLIKQKLPEALSQGIGITVNKQDSAHFNINVLASPEYNNTQVYILVHTRGIRKITQAILIKDNRGNFQFNQEELGDGISSITLFNNLLQPLCERLIFKRPSKKLLIHANTDLPVYNNRKPVSLDLSAIGTDGQPPSVNLSLSVFQIDSLQGISEEDIVSYLYLSSDLKGRVESPNYYFNNSDAQADQAIDNLMLTQGWRRFNWKEVFDNRKANPEFLPEMEGPVVTGKIINKLTGLPVGMVNAFLSIPGADYAFSSATSNAGGLIRFSFKDVYKNNVLVLQPASANDSNDRIDISNAYSDRISSRLVSPMIISKQMEEILVNRSINNQVENTYRIDKKRQFINGRLDITSFYGKPDKNYNLEDYVRFQTMEEVFREYVEDVRVRKDGNKFNFKVRNRLFGTYFEESPLILLDGIPIYDATRIIDQNPLKIQKIEVVMHNYHLGSSVFEGIVNIRSYSGELGVSQIDPNALVVEYEGLQQQREFYSPRYISGDDTQSHLPDFRNVLYWSPQIKTGPGGKAHLLFYTSDLNGKFAAVIQGISTDGQPGQTVCLFDVHGPN